MERCVDALVGQVLSAVVSARESRQFSRTITIIFTSDHGDYGGSHNLHNKGGALYDEIMNVPLYISFLPNTLTVPTTRTYVCSSVDILPFIYSMALGNESWRSTGSSCDIVTYLSGRESIRDALASGTATQRRLTTIPNSTNSGYLPYVLHTNDEFPGATEQDSSGLNVNQPSHALAFRTVDITVTSSSGPAVAGNYGGGKLGVYVFWPSASSCGSTPITWPVVGNSAKPLQFEFYDYTGGNLGEEGNDAFCSPGEWNETAITYITNLNAIIQRELYGNEFRGGLRATVQAAYAAAYQDYANFQTSCTSDCTVCAAPSPGSCDVQIPVPTEGCSG